MHVAGPVWLTITSWCDGEAEGLVSPARKGSSGSTDAKSQRRHVLGNGRAGWRLLGGCFQKEQTLLLLRCLLRSFW